MRGHNVCFYADLSMIINKISANTFSHLDLCYLNSLILISQPSLTLKAPNKNCSRQHFNFLLLSFKKIRLDFSSRGFTRNIKSYFL